MIKHIYGLSHEYVSSTENIKKEACQWKTSQSRRKLLLCENSNLVDPLGVVSTQARNFRLTFLDHLSF